MSTPSPFHTNHTPDKGPGLLITKSLVKYFGNRKVVSGVSISVSASEVVGLLGRNGAGKTTTFKMIMGLIEPKEGSITFKGKDITRLPVYLRAREGIGYLSQEPSVFQQMTVYTNILAIAEIANIRVTKDRILQLLDEYNLSKVTKQMAHTLSGGEKRRLEICRALILNPSLVLLDEPFSGLDPISVQEIQEMIHSLRQRGISVILTDHNVRETLSVTDRAYILDHGTIIAEGTKEQIISNERVIKSYLGKSFAF